MRSDGTEPRRLARGAWHSWSQDSSRIYYKSRVDNRVYSVSTQDGEANPRPILACSRTFPSVSPDEKRVAYFEKGWLKVEDLASHTVIGQWEVPFDTWGGASWSGTGRELCLGGAIRADVRVGLWIYGLGREEPTNVLCGQIDTASWSSDQTKLTFTLGPPYFEVWAADLDPNGSTVDSLGPGRTTEEHHRQMVSLYTRRIHADPTDAHTYLRRAEQYRHLRQERKASADMRRYASVAAGATPSGSWLDSWWSAEHVIEGPSGWQLVFSVEDRGDGTKVLSGAFGQKGSSGTRSFEVPLFLVSLVGLLLSGPVSPPAHAGLTFGEPVDVQSVIPDVTGDDIIDCLSDDGLDMYITSGRGGGQGNWDIWVLKRASKDDRWGPAQNLGPAVNSDKVDWLSCISSDGLTLYFTSNREGKHHIFVTTRATKDSPWGQAVRWGPETNPGSHDYGPWISADGLELYFSSERSGSGWMADIYVARRTLPNDPWGPGVNVGGPVSQPSHDEVFVSLSPDGLLMLFSDHWTTSTHRPGGQGDADVWMSRRTSPSSPWQEPVNLGPQVNGPAKDIYPRISPDGQTLYFRSNRAGWNTWQAPIIANHDLNGDGDPREEAVSARP